MTILSQEYLSTSLPGSTGLLYQLSKNRKASTIIGWSASTVENTFHSGRRRPALIDLFRIYDIKVTLSECCRKQKTLSKTEFANLVFKGVVGRKRDRGMGFSDITCSNKTIKRLIDKHSIQEGKRQFKMHARIAAERDARNAYSMHVIVSAFCEDLIPNLIINWYATQYVISCKPKSTGILLRPKCPIG